jgi:hypothetical protein
MLRPNRYFPVSTATAAEVLVVAAAFAILGGLRGALGSPAPEAGGSPPCDWYVATNGLDTNPGTAGQPFRTIQKGADVATVGETVCVAAGLYEERPTIGTSGSNGSPITLQAQGAATSRGFDIAADYIVLDGFTVGDASGTGISIEGHYNRVANNVVLDSSSYGIVVVGTWADVYTQATHNVVEYNRIERARTSGIQVFGTDNLIAGNEISHTLVSGDADGIRFFGSNNTLRGNHIHDIYLSEAPGAHIDCFQTWGPATNITIEGNFCDNPDNSMQGTMIEQINEPVGQLTFRNNVFKMGADWYGPGINVIAKSEQSIIQDVTVVSNTFVRTSGAGQYSVYLTRVTNGVIQNNIVYDGVRPPFYLVSTTNVTAGYNLVFRSQGGQPEGSPAANDIWQQDPLFVDAASDDFRLQSASPAIDAGVPLGIDHAFDFNGVTRPQGEGWDMGAFEVDESTPPEDWIFVEDFESGDTTAWAAVYPEPPPGPSKIDPIGVKASADDGNIPENTLDGDLGTRWSADGQGQWIRYDLGSVQNIEEVRIAFYIGNQRTSTFDIQVSQNDTDWTTVLSTTSGGDTLQLQHFSFSSAPARYVRYLGYGNSQNNWNSLTEVEIWGQQH